MTTKHSIVLVAVVLAVISGLALARPTYAGSSTDVIISEFQSIPATGQQEWYEVMNTTLTTVDLDDWYIQRSATGDQIQLTGSLPPYGIKVFFVDASTANDAGDGLYVYYAPSGGLPASGVTYGTVPSSYPIIPHVAAPGLGQSAAMTLTGGTTPAFSVATTPSLGWFNGAVDYSCSQMTAGTQTSAPTLSSIAGCLLSEFDVTTNMGTLANPSAATELYFEKSVSGSPVGRITFAGPLNLSDMDTVTFLKGIGEKMQAALANGAVKVGLDTSTASMLNNVAATITMYQVPGTTQPSLVVYGNDGKEIDPSSASYPTITPGTFDATAHTYTFSTSHFTTFETASKPAVKNIATNNGQYTFKSGSKTITLTPFSGYRGKTWSKKIDFGGNRGVVYIFANLGAFKTGAIKVYDKNGKLLGTYKPFTGYATTGLTLEIAVKTDNQVYIATTLPKSATSVRFYRITTKGLTSINTVKALTTGNVLVIKFSKIYGSDYGLLTYVKGKRSTIKVWKYNTATKKFVEDKTYDKNKIKI